MARGGGIGVRNGRIPPRAVPTPLAAVVNGANLLNHESDAAEPICVACFAADVLIGPGAKPGTMPSNLEQATGPEREQYLAALGGKKRFITEPQPPKHFGTKQNPVVIYTHFDERQVGCQGTSSLPSLVPS